MDGIYSSTDQRDEPEVKTMDQFIAFLLFKFPSVHCERYAFKLLARDVANRGTILISGDPRSPVLCYVISDRSSHKSDFLQNVSNKKAPNVLRKLHDRPRAWTRADEAYSKSMLWSMIPGIQPP